jgi:triosephosphate isomerase
MTIPLIVGNWKMHKTASEAAALVRELVQLAPSPGVDAVLAPPFTALSAVAGALGSTSPYALGAQNLHWEDQGAFTGEISGAMLRDLGCRHVIVGHSERRRLFGEDDRVVNRKLLAALRHGLRPILCVGETLEEREAGATLAVIERQLTAALALVGHEHQLDDVTVAYEPVWAIGTGRAATPEQATEAHRALRKALTNRLAAPGRGIRILYGGSVTAENAGGFLSADEVAGALVGGACLDPRSFARILGLAREIARA